MHRRGIFGVLAGAFTAGPAAVKAALEDMGPSLLAARPLAETVYTEATAPCAPVLSPWQIPEGRLRDLIHAASRRMEQEREIMGEIRHRIATGLDQDITVNQSWSPAYKHQIQAERVRQERSVEFALRERLWGH